MLNTLRNLGWPLAVGVLVALLIMQRYPELVGLEPMPYHLHQAPPSRSSAPPYSYAEAVNRAAPAVVDLYATTLLDDPAADQRDAPALERFIDDSAGNGARIAESLGSAVIMSQEGYLLTNHHVTKDADQIIVALKDGREAQARVIGSDPETDLAVLKIDLPNLPAIRLGRSEEIRIGDVALAIGNPLGIGQTVTMGIISATGRHQLGLNTYEDFIQTDAAINRGNSGGALLDASGNLIGINTAILPQSRGTGIGFAIPVKLALEVMDSIIQHGQVIRGWLGVEVQTLTPELAESFGLKDHQGIVVTGVYQQGPAHRAGLQPGDLLVSIDGVPALDGRNSMNQVARVRPGEKVDIVVLRDGRALTLHAQVGMRPKIEPVSQQP